MINSHLNPKSGKQIMPYTIPNNDCVGCDNCQPQMICPTGAIKKDNDGFWIDPSLCNNCEGFHPEPKCAVVCPAHLPLPLQVKRGRCKTEPRELTSPDLFSNGKSHPFASAIVIWEACNVLAQRESLPWETDGDGNICYQRIVNQGRSAIAFHLATKTNEMTLAQDITAVSSLDIRAAALNLIFAAHVTGLERPWKEEFIIDDRQIERYLGLEKRKDLNKTAKLVLIQTLVNQVCQLVTSIDWSQQGQISSFEFEKSRIWHLTRTQHYFQTDEAGCKYLVGLTFTIRPGIWTKYFLNKQECQQRKAFYQYGTLPKSLPSTIMSIWQQHEGTARLMLWLLFKTKMGKEQRITVPTLLRVAYGEAKIATAYRHRDERKRLLRTFESDLEVLNHYGMKPKFDPVTYPPNIQPLWAKLVDIPEDPDEAIEFWINDAGDDGCLTNVAPRGKWNLLMNARILSFDLPPELENQLAATKKKQHHKKARKKNKVVSGLLGEQITQARQNLNLSQRELAKLAGKSQSWIRDIEKGRLKAKLEDQLKLREVLGIG